MIALHPGLVAALINLLRFFRLIIRIRNRSTISMAREPEPWLAEKRIDKIQNRYRGKTYGQAAAALSNGWGRGVSKGQAVSWCRWYWKALRGGHRGCIKAEPFSKSHYGGLLDHYQCMRSGSNFISAETADFIPDGAWNYNITINPAMTPRCPNSQSLSEAGFSFLFWRLHAPYGWCFTRALAVRWQFPFEILQNDNPEEMPRFHIQGTESGTGDFRAFTKMVFHGRKSYCWVHRYGTRIRSRRKNLSTKIKTDSGDHSFFHAYPVNTESWVSETLTVTGGNLTSEGPHPKATFCVNRIGMVFFMGTEPSGRCLAPWPLPCESWRFCFCFPGVPKSEQWEFSPCIVNQVMDPWQPDGPQDGVELVTLSNYWGPPPFAYFRYC